MTQEIKKIAELSDFEQFIHDRGFEFKTDDALRAAYDRDWKCSHGILISEEEFIAEANCGGGYNEDVLKDVYKVLAGLVQTKILDACAVYRYAYYRWCLRNPEAIVAYQSGRDKWEVNNCATTISEEAAIVEVNREWGFEASRIKIIGTPYYDATDWQFIRFDCAQMTWLWANKNLYQVYE